MKALSSYAITQPASTGLKTAMETPKQCEKSFQSKQ